MKKRDTKRPRESEIARKLIEKYYASEGRHKVQERLKKKGIKRSLGRIQDIASELGVHHRDPERIKMIRQIIQEKYGDNGATATAAFIKKTHGFRVNADYIRHVASDMGIKHSGYGGGSGKWTLALSEVEREEFLADFRNAPGLPDGITNQQIVEKWSGKKCTNDEMILAGARALGETKNRIQIRHQVTTPAQIEKMTEEAFVSAITQNALIDPGEDALFERVKKNLAQPCKDAGYEITRDRFNELLDKALWTEGKQGRLTILNDYIKSGMSAEEFQKDHPFIPLKMVKEKIQEERGVTNRLRRIRFESGLLRGVGRYASPEELRSGEDFKFPKNDFHNPHPIFTRDAGSILILNGANVGLKHVPTIKGNPRVNALLAAKEDSDDAVLITNTIDLYTKKAAGASRVLAAIWSGMNVDPELFPESYKREVLETLKTKPDDAVIYQKPRESLHNALSGWNKITWEPVSKWSKEVRPVFPKNVYVVFGLREHQFAAVMAYWHVHYLTRIKQERNKARLSAAYGILREVEKGKVPMPTDLEGRLWELHDIDERTIISDVMDEFWQLYYYRAVGYLAKKFEEVIPNCKVIGMSTTHVKLGPETLTIHIPADARITDTTLSQYTHAYGPKVLRKEMSRFVAICHPYGLGPRGTAREVDAEGQRDHALVWTAPACVEEAYLRQQQKRIPGREHPIAQKIWNEISTPGVLRVRLVNGALVPEDISIETLDRYAGRRAA